MSVIVEKMQSQIQAIRHQIGAVANVLIVVDHQYFTFDGAESLMHFAHFDSSDIIVLGELDSNYFMSLEFSVSGDAFGTTSRCHLFYGCNEKDKMRFYPEYLTTVIPRFFVMNQDLIPLKVNHYQRLQALYDDKYKHGFAVDLYDHEFNIFYKIITKYEHVSINYDRKIVHDDHDEVKHSEYVYKSIKWVPKCNAEQKHEIEECSFIDFIIYTLNIFKSMTKTNVIDHEKFNLQKLIKCYDHIVCVHLFCLKSNERIKIQQYVSKLVGKCWYTKKCKSMTAHSMRKREENTKQPYAALQKYNKSDIFQDVLMSCLNSLHCYLLHDADKLYRLERDSRKTNQRFSTH
eukprot:520_1